MKKQELTDYLRQGYENGLIYAVDNNPRGAYDVLQQAFPHEFPKWAPGVESNDASKAEMLKFLIQKANSTPLDSQGGIVSPAVFVAEFMQAVPFNPNPSGYAAWTKITD